MCTSASAPWYHARAYKAATPFTGAVQCPAYTDLRILSVLQQTFTTLNHTNIVNQGSRKQKGFRNNKKSSFPLFFLSLTSLKGGCKPYFQALLCHQNHKRLRRIYFQKQRHLVKHKLSLRHMTKNSRIGSAAIAFCIETRKKDSPVKWLLKVSQ